MDQGPFTETNSHAAREEIFRPLWSTVWHVCQYTLSWAKTLDESPLHPRIPFPPYMRTVWKSFAFSVIIFIGIKKTG